MGAFYVKIILMEGSVEVERTETATTPHEEWAREGYDLARAGASLPDSLLPLARTLNPDWSRE